MTWLKSLCYTECMSGKITFLLIAALAGVIYLGVKMFGSQVSKMGQTRQVDVYQQRELISGKKQEMKLTSSAFKNGESIPKEYTCDGSDINPRLEISNVPPQAESLILIFDDPDSVGEVWDHWLVWDISPNTKTIGLRSVPKGAGVGVNDFGEFGYSGPCPPSGEHRYMFRLYALDIMLNLESSSSREQLDQAMENHVIAKTGLMGRYRR